MAWEGEMAAGNETERFVGLLTAHQNRLFGYIHSLLGDHNRAADVLQETNLVLWRKAGEFVAERPFLPWAFAIARFQVMAHLRDRGRDRCVLAPALVELVAEEAESQADRFEDTRRALRHCIARLPAGGRDLIERRYFRATAVKDLAAQDGKGLSAVKVALWRLRRRLAECVRLRLAAEANS